MRLVEDYDAESLGWAIVSLRIVEFYNAFPNNEDSVEAMSCH
jgi:hypothetical protein